MVWSVNYKYANRYHLRQEANILKMLKMLTTQDCLGNCDEI